MTFYNQQVLNHYLTPLNKNSSLTANMNKHSLTNFLPNNLAQIRINYHMKLHGTGFPNTLAKHNTLRKLLHFRCQTQFYN